METTRREWTDTEVAEFLQGQIRLALAVASRWCGEVHAEEAVADALAMVTVRHINSQCFSNRAEREVWVYFRRALGTSCRQIRKRLRTQGYQFDASRDTRVSDGADDPHSQAARSESILRIQDALSGIDPELQAILRRRMEGETFQSIADADGVPLGRIYRQHGKALSDLRLKLEE